METKSTARQPDARHTAGVRSFFASRWRGEAPLRPLVLREMLVLGTTANVVAAFAGLLLFAADAPSALAAAVFFSPLPYNVFIVTAVWRSAAKTAAPWAPAAQLGAAAWFVVMLLI